MNSTRLFAVVIAVSALAVFAGQKMASSGVIYMGHQDVSEAFARGGILLATNNFKILALRRTEAGDAEIHDADTDVVYVLEGSATLVTGGTAVGARAAGPGETRASRIERGEERSVTKGDVIVIPKRVPHWYKDIKGRFLYYVVKVSG